MIFFSILREVLPGRSIWIIASTGIILNLITASASYLWVEKPFLRLKKRYAKVTVGP